MRAAPLARRTLTTLEAKAGASSGNNASSSPGEIKRWPITIPEKRGHRLPTEARDQPSRSASTGAIGLVSRAHGGKRTRKTRLNNSSCNQPLAWRCRTPFRGSRVQLTLILGPRRSPAARYASITPNDFARCQSCRDDPAGPIDHATRRNGKKGRG